MSFPGFDLRKKAELGVGNVGEEIVQEFVNTFETGMIIYLIIPAIMFIFFVLPLVNTYGGFLKRGYPQLIDVRISHPVLGVPPFMDTPIWCMSHLQSEGGPPIPATA